MNKQFYLHIGNLYFTKRAVLLLIFGSFLTDVVIGFSVLSVTKWNLNFSPFFYLLFNFLFWFFISKKLRNEIIEL